uniref:F-box domain-containing protein n=1 Tax=Glossina pallidipes TaxID=7398 RepID=A0A1B0A3Z6_GLOPL
MEQGEVSEKVGREVLRAVWLLTKCYDKNHVPESGRIKNLLATYHLKNVVDKCLENLSDVGLLHERFSVCKGKFSNTNVRRGDVQLFDKRSVTNDEDDCTTKRLRPNDDDVLYIGDKKPFFKVCQRCCDNFLNITYGRNENVGQSQLEISSQTNSSSMQTVESINNIEEIARATIDKATLSKATSANNMNESNDEQLALSPDVMDTFSTKINDETIKVPALPSEIWQQIFGHLFGDLRQVKLVCKDWEQLAGRSVLKRKFKLVITTENLTDICDAMEHTDLKYKSVVIVGGPDTFSDMQVFKYLGPYMVELTLNGLSPLSALNILPKVKELFLFHA